MGSINKAPNPHLRWEKTRDVKVALDFGLFGDRVTGLVEGYWRKSTDVISRVRVVSSTGYNAQSYNASDIENKGVEATLGVKVIDRRDYRLSFHRELSVKGSMSVTRWNQFLVERNWGLIPMTGFICINCVRTPW